MGKFWLKSVDPSKQCCGCEGKSSPCDNCCAIPININSIVSGQQIANCTYLLGTNDKYAKNTKSLDIDVAPINIINNKQFGLSVNKNDSITVEYGGNTIIATTGRFNIINSENNLAGPCRYTILSSIVRPGSNFSEQKHILL